MKKYLVIAALGLLMTAGCVNQDGGVEKDLEQVCLDSGGTISAGTCCASAEDYPNLCAIGACGCSLENSHEVKICECPEGQCWDGSKCAAR